MKRGFTLIELVIVIVILGVLSAVAIPKYVDLTTEAKNSATKGALGGLRAGIYLFYAQQALVGTARFPTGTIEVVNAMEQGAPANPWVTGASSTSIVTTSAAATNAAAWVYVISAGNVDDGKIYAGNNTTW